MVWTVDQTTTNEMADDWNELQLKNFIGLQNDKTLLDADTSIVTVTQDSTDPSLTRSILYRDNPEYFYHSTALEELLNGNQIRLKTTSKLSGGNVSTTGSQVQPSWEFWTDAEIIVLNIRRNSEITLQIDDVFYSKDNLIVGDFGDNDSDVKLEFANKKKRKITINISSSASGFAGVKVSPTDSVWKESPRLKACFVGDSFSTGTAPNIAGLAYTAVLMKELGISGYMVSGDGSTGFVNNATNTKLNYIERVSDVTDIDFDVVFVSSTINDAAYTDAEIQANCETWYNAIRANSEDIFIVVCGAPSSSSATNMISTEQSVIDAFNSFNDSKVYIIPTTTSLNPPVSGTGNDGSPANDGNADIYIDSDGTHFNTDGHQYYGFWLAQKVTELFN